MRADAGHQWLLDDRLEAYVRDRLVKYARFFQNYEGDYLSMMEATIPGQFNRSGHGIDIMALDRRGALWIIEVSRGRIDGAASVKTLGDRKHGTAQMAPAWRTLKKDKFLEQDDAQSKLEALLDVRGMSKAQTKELLEMKLESHRAAVIVPEGCHVEGNATGLRFSQDIYTFAVSLGVRLHSRRK